MNFIFIFLNYSIIRLFDYSIIFCAQQFWCTMFAVRPIPPLVFLVLNKFLDLSHSMAEMESAGSTHPCMGPPHLYLEFSEAGTPMLDGRPGRLFRCVVWFTLEALLATFLAVILLMMIGWSWLVILYFQKIIYFIRA